MTQLLDGTWQVYPCDRNDISEFIEQHHYSGSINGVKGDYYFLLEHNHEVVGGMIYGTLGMANVWRKYGEQERDVIELRRLCLIDDTPRNAESFFIARTLKWLRENTDIKTVISYADPNYGHEGTIYKASNFEMVGMTSPGKVIMWNGKKYHDKTLRVKYKGELKPYAIKLRQAMESGEAYYVKQDPKYIYVKQLRKTRRRKSLT